ncbi:MAG: ribonuclease R [Candidatus Wallbacteria bacterium]|nr:ribonuclease R [Candidatus Wallbacteria bacterium]
MKNLRDRVLELMLQSDYRPLTLFDLLRELKLKPRERHPLETTLEGLVSEGRIVLNRSRCYGLPEKMDLIAGELEVKQAGFGFLIPDQVGAADVHIPATAMAGAMHKDRVMVRIEHREADRLSGRVVRILERFHKRVLGVFRSGGASYGFVTPSDVHLSQEVYIPAGMELDARPGQVVEVDLVEYPTETKGGVGKITRVLGAPGDKGIDTEIIIREYNLRDTFPAAVMAEAEKLPDEVRVADRRGRRDLRKLLTFTIDPETARDYDDAISIERDGDHVVLGVHIADVSHYVRPGSAIDDEAVGRSTSVYFPERVLPMLPEKLSNGLCSLKPNVDRLSMTCRMRFNRQGKMAGSEIFASVIHSDYRLTYELAGQLLAGEDAKLLEKYSRLMPDLRTFAELAQAIRARRQQRGSLLFTLPETRIVLDDQWRMVDIRKEVADLSHHIIEEAMIAANEAVAEFVEASEKPFVYRIHELPDPEKVQTLAKLAAALGIPWREVGSPSPRAYQRILQQVQGKPEQMLVTTILLRTLKQARYHSENAGHFGLASRAYTHFTSPIRRYPDLMVHRFLKEYIAFDKAAVRGKSESDLELDKATMHASRQERVAAEAEQELVSWKKARFMESHLGETFDGTVTGVAAFGLFVEIEPYFVEGMVHVSKLGREYFLFDEAGFAMVGQGTGKCFRIGDRLKVRVARVDEVKRQVDFELEAVTKRQQETQEQKSPTEPPRRWGRNPRYEERRKRRDTSRPARRRRR